MGRKKKEQPLIKIDCEDCADRHLYGGCSKDRCPWLENQIPMGSVTYGEAATKHFFRYKELRPRVNQAVNKYEGPWTNMGHIPRMQTARKMTRCFTEKDTSRYHAVMYLLTSSFDLFARLLGCFSEDGLYLNRAELRNISPHNRALFNAACKIYNGNDQVLLTDLTGRDPMQDCCEKYNVPYALALAIAEVESHFNPDAKSSTNDYGLMQINAINLDWLRDMGMDPLTPAGNIESGVYIIAQHLQAYGDPELALMAYNNGPTGAGKLWDEGIYQTGYNGIVFLSYLRFVWYFV